MTMSVYLSALSVTNLIGRMPAAVAQGVIWGLMALGVFITFRLLDIPDMTVDGSFATGGAVTVMLLLAGMPAWAALLIAIVVGVVTGLCTGFLHTKLGIPAILAGILTQFALYSINLRIMTRANQTASVQKFGMIWENGDGFLVSSLHIPQAILVGLVIAAIIVALSYWYFGTEQGSALRATGNNPAMSRAQGIHIETMKVIGLGISNGIVALAGGLMTQFQGTADVSMGRGAIVIGLAAIVIGEILCDAIFSKGCNFAVKLCFIIFGGIVYYAVMVVILWLKLDPNDLKLFTAIIVAIFLAIPEIKNVSKTFNPGTINEKHALSNLSLSLNDGDFVTVIGGNGAGKSTLLNAVAGVWPVDSGAILIDGEDVTGMPEYKRAKYIGRVFQDPMMGTAPNMQIEENLALAMRRGKKRGLKWGVTSAEREAYRAKLATLGLGLEDRLTAKVGLLSGGQRQALTLLMASLQTPKLLLLDEHTAALDPGTAKKVLELSDKIISENKLTALMITHNMTDAIRHGNRLIMMDRGRIVLDISGEEKSRLTKADLLERFAEKAGVQEETDAVLLS